MARQRAATGINLVEDGWEDQDVWETWKPPVRIVRGTSSRQAVIEDVIGPPRDGGYRQPTRVTLKRDPRNQADPNAIRVLIDGDHVGFIAKELAPSISSAMEEEDIEAFDVPAMVVGGDTERRSFGVWIFSTRHFPGGIRLSHLCSGEDWRVGSDTWDYYCSWEDDDTPPDGDDDKGPSWDEVLEAVERAASARQSLETERLSKPAGPAIAPTTSVHPVLAFVVVVLVTAFVLYACRDVYLRVPVRKRASAPAITAKITANLLPSGAIRCHNLLHAIQVRHLASNTQTLTA